jgi:hypothetical protein
MLNFSSQEQQVRIPEVLKGREMEVLVSPSRDGGDQRLGPWDGRVHTLTCGGGENIRS